MNSLRIIVSSLFLILGSYITIMNWGCLIVSMINKKKKIDKHHSMVPVISLVAIALAYFLFPSGKKIWFWIIPIIDIGNWVLIFGLPFVLVREVFKK